MVCIPSKPLCLLLLGIVSLAIRPDALPIISQPERMNALPRRTLWVWERPEDLRSIDSRTTAIAVLERTIVLGHSATLIPRRQPFIYPAGAKRIAVVRIEAPGTIDPSLEEPTAGLILDTLSGSPAAALQIDFDARRSQQAFYAALLRDVRRHMPPGLPLSITALASWCSSDDWLRGLPVDEAVPMFFRMEPDRRYASLDAPQFQIREPLCMSSIGISTHEPRPVSLAGKRIYIFPDRGWHEDLPLLAEGNLAQRIQP
jgi:hypothetical protein